MRTPSLDVELVVVREGRRAVTFARCTNAFVELGKRLPDMERLAVDGRIAEVLSACRTGRSVTPFWVAVRGSCEAVSSTQPCVERRTWRASRESRRARGRVLHCSQRPGSAGLLPCAEAIRRPARR